MAIFTISIFISMPTDMKNSPCPHADKTVIQQLWEKLITSHAGHTGHKPNQVSDIA